MKTNLGRRPWLCGCSPQDAVIGSIIQGRDHAVCDDVSPKDNDGSNGRGGREQHGNKARAYDETSINPLDLQNEWLARFESPKTISTSPSTDQTSVTEANTGGSSSSDSSSSFHLDFQVKNEEPPKCMSMSLMESFWEDYDSEADEDINADAKGLSRELKSCSLRDHELQKQVFGDFLLEETTSTSHTPSRGGDESTSGTTTLQSSAPELNYAFERIKVQGESELDYVLNQMQVTRKPTSHISIFRERNEQHV